MRNDRILETERLYLREMTQADFPSLCKILRVQGETEGRYTFLL